MKLVTSMFVTGVETLNTPFLATTLTGTVMFWQCLADATPAKAVAAAAIEYFILAEGLKSSTALQERKVYV